MGATTWSPTPYLSKQEWLLKDGTIAVSPDLESSTSGRRLRIAGTKQSVGQNEVQALVTEAMKKIAADRGTETWMQLDPNEFNTHLANVGGGEVSWTARPNFHLSDPNSDKTYGLTTLVWEFKTPGMPAAYVWLGISNRYGDRYSVVTRLSYRSLHPSASGDLTPMFYEGVNTWVLGRNIYRNDPEAQAFTTWSSGRLPTDTVEFGTRNFQGNQRKAATYFAETAAKINALASVDVPDTSSADPTTYKWLTLPIARTTYTSAVMQEVVAFCQAGPAIERLTEHLNGVRQALRSLGMVVKTPSLTIDSLSAVGEGDFTALTVRVEASEDEDVQADGIDPYHTVAINVATGAVIVNCSHKEEGLSEATEAYNIAKFKAEMMGETDELLAYVTAYQEPQQKRRARRITKQRDVASLPALV